MTASDDLFHAVVEVVDFCEWEEDVIGFYLFLLLRRSLVLSNFSLELLILLDERVVVVSPLDFLATSIHRHQQSWSVD